MTIIMGIFVGFVAWFLVRYLVAGIFTVNQNERVVKTSVGRATRVGDIATDPISDCLSPEEKFKSFLTRNSSSAASRS